MIQNRSIIFIVLYLCNETIKAYIFLSRNIYKSDRGLLKKLSYVSLNFHDHNISNVSKSIFDSILFKSRIIRNCKKSKNNNCCNNKSVTNLCTPCFQAL